MDRIDAHRELMDRLIRMRDEGDVDGLVAACVWQSARAESIYDEAMELMKEPPTIGELDFWLDYRLGTYAHAYDMDHRVQEIMGSAS